MSGLSLEDWERREALLDRVLDLPESECADFLRQLQRSHPEDAAAVREWLGAIRDSEGRWAPSATPMAAIESGETIGSWRLLRLLGRGGMGEVWLGERADGLYQKQVAIKFIRDDRPELARSIESERRLLAGLQHPGIVRLLDAGTRHDGQPWLVTEYIDGVALDVWLRAQHPDLDARLDLFDQLADAVSHAHEHLIIHRDIKPANVLVDAAGRAHLLDFGIARALAGDGELQGETLVALTPDFAAPELIGDNLASVRSDVYALGGLLYFLLCEQVPLPLQGLSLGAMIERVREHEPQPPSRNRVRMDHAGRAPSAGDLDLIALKALGKEPAARYGSVAALREDLANARARRPIRARPPSQRDRAWRFLQRHRLGAAVAAAVLLAVLAGIAGTLWQAQEARAQRDRAEAEAKHAMHEAQTASATRDFLIGLFESANPALRGEQAPSIVELIDTGVLQAQSTLHEEPEIQLRLLQALGRTYTGLGEYDKAVTALDQAYGLALKHFPQNRALGTAVAIDYASAAGHSETRTDTAMAMLRTILDPDRPLDGVSLQQQAVARVQLASLQYKSGVLDEAEENFERATADLTELGSPAAADLAEGLRQWAGLEISRGHRDAGVARLREALAIQLALPSPAPTQINATRTDLASELGKMGLSDEAVEILRDVVASDRQIFGDEHPRTLESSSWLARALLRQSAYEEADRILEHTLQLALSRQGPDSLATATARISLAASKFAQGDLDAAIALNRQVLDYAMANGGPDSYRTIVVTQNIARFQLANGEYQAALDTAKQVLEAMRRIGSNDLANAQELMGTALLYMGKPAAALDRHSTALESLARNGDTRSIDVQMLRASMAEDARDLGHFDAAREHLTRAIQGLSALEQAANDDLLASMRAQQAELDVLQGRCSGVDSLAVAHALRQETTPTPVGAWQTARLQFFISYCTAQHPASDTATALRDMKTQAKILLDSPLVSPQIKAQVRTLTARATPPAT